MVVELRLGEAGEFLAQHLRYSFSQACKKKLGLKQNNMKRKKINNDEKKKQARFN